MARQQIKTPRKGKPPAKKAMPASPQIPPMPPGMVIYDFPLEKPKTTMMGVRVPDEIKAKLERFAQMDDRNLTSLVTKILREWVEAREAEIFKGK